jgi:zinc protease
MAQLQPDVVPQFFTIAQEIAADLAARPVTPDELARVIEPMRQRVTRASTSAAFFMYQLEGATTDPTRLAAIRTLLRDYTVATPEQMQALAARYLKPGKDWKLAVLPQEVTGAPPTPAVR